jgi:hypothetical protein
MPQSKKLVIKKNSIEIEISDLDYDKEAEFFISESDRSEQNIFLDLKDLIKIKEHIEYLINKANN